MCFCNRYSQDLRVLRSFAIPKAKLPSGKEFLLFASSGIIVMISAWAFTAAFHIAGKYSSVISPFIFLQILWGTLYGIIFFNEQISFSLIVGIFVIITSGSIAVYNRNK